MGSTRWMPGAPPTPAVTSKNVFGNCQVSSWRAKLSLVGNCSLTVGRPERIIPGAHHRAGRPFHTLFTGPWGQAVLREKRSLARAGRDLLKQVWSGGVPGIPTGLPNVHICRKTIHSCIPQIIWVPPTCQPQWGMPWTEVRTSLASCTPAGSTRARPTLSAEQSSGRS